MTTIGRRLRSARLAQGRTLREVAEAVGVTAVYVHDIEAGNRLPVTSGVIERLCAVLEIEVGDTVLEALNAKMPPGYRVVKETQS